MPTHNLAKEIDEGFELKSELKALTVRSDEIKKKLINCIIHFLKEYIQQDQVIHPS